MSDTKFQQSYTIFLIGGHGTGKTSFIERHKTGQFIEKYVPTLTLKSQSLKFNTTLGLVNLTVYDCPVDDQKYLTQKCDAVISFYTSQSHNKTQELLDSYTKCHPGVLVVTVWGLCDLKEETRFMKPYMKTESGCKFLTKGKQIYQVSGKSNYNFEKPFLYIMRQLSGNQSLNFAPFK